MHRSTRALIMATFAAAAASSSSILACDNEAAEATVSNELPVEGGDAFTVERLWYRTTLFVRAIPPGATSESLRVGTGAEPAYAVLVIGEPPRRFVARSNDAVVTEPGESVRIVVSQEAMRSTCLGSP